MCLVAFQKIFRKIFSGVWKRRRKTKIQKTQATTLKKKSSTTKMFPVRRPRRRSRSEIAIDSAIVIRDHDQRRDRDLAFARSCRRSRSRTRAGARAVFAFVGLELARSARTGAWSLPAIVELTGSSPLARALSLSLSFFGNPLKVK